MNMEKLFKNISKLFVLTLAVALISCGGDDEVVLPDGPTITINSNQLSASASYEATAGEEVTFTVTVNAPGIFNNVSVTSGGGTPITESKTAGSTETTHTTQPIKFTVSEGDVGATGSIEITAVDDNNKTSSVTLEFTVKSAPLTPANIVMLAAPLADFTATSFYSTNTGELYAPSAVNASNDPLSNDIDFGYYYGSTNNATIASPSGFVGSAFATQVEKWGTKNETTLLATTLTSTDFIETTTTASLIEKFDKGTDGSQFRTGLSEGDVIAFQTSATKTNSPSKKGLILIKKINGTFNQNDNIEIEVIVEK